MSRNIGLALAWRCSVAAICVSRFTHTHASIPIGPLSRFYRQATQTLQPHRHWQWTGALITVPNSGQTPPWQRGFSKVSVPLTKQLIRCNTVEDVQTTLQTASSDITYLTPTELYYVTGRLNKHYAKSPTLLANNPLWHQLLQRFQTVYTQMSFEHAAICITILLKLGLQDEEILSSVLMHLTPHLQELPINHLINLMHSVAKDRHQEAATQAGLRTDYATFFAAASARVAAIASSSPAQLTTQAISNAMNACALVSHVNPHMCSALAAAAHPQFNTFTPQQLSTMLWAWAKLAEAGLQQPPPWPTCEALSQAAILQAPDFTPHNITNIFWAWATLHDCLKLPPHPPLFRAMATRLTACLAQPTQAHTAHTAHTAPKPPALANTLWACAKLRFHDTQLMAAIVKAATTSSSIKLLRPLDTIHLVCALARLGQPVPAKLLPSLQQQLPHVMPTWQRNALWALAVSAACSSKPGARPVAPAALATAVQQLPAAQNVRKLKADDLCKMFMVHLLLAALRQPNKAKLKALVDAVQTAAPASSPQSSFQQQVALAAQQLLCTQPPPAAAPCVELADPLYPSPIDIALQWEGWPVALLTDGPHYFSCNQPYKLMGKCLLRNFLLSSLGWVVVELPFYEWEEVKDGSLQAQQQYLHTKLEAAVAGVIRSGMQLSSPVVVRALRVLHGTVAT